jgi:GTP-binding protein
MIQPVNKSIQNKESGHRPFRVIIMGRPNTGKSTLFNRMIGRRRALVHNEPGVTRDRNEATVEWKVGGQSLPVLVVDTGGLGGDRFANEIEAQVRTALENADMVLFVFDGQAGLTPLDQELLRDLNRSGALEKTTPLLGIVNKVDAEVHEERVADFYSAGLENIMTISAEHGRGLDDLKEVIFEAARQAAGNSFISLMEKEPEKTKSPSRRSKPDSSKITPVVTDITLDETELTEEPDTFVYRTPAVAIVGRPNVGKSTLFNAIIGENRMITSPIAGTTVDSVDSTVLFGDRKFLFVDTAGIRKKSKTEQGIEVLSVVQAKKALERADIALLVIDGEKGITDQDQKISSLVEEAGCSVILVLNKWDLHRKNVKFTTEMASKRIRAEMAHLKYAPILFVSALRQQGLENLGDLIEEILSQRRLKIATHEFTEWVREEASVHNPKNARFYLCHQSGRNPPTFVCHVNDPEKIDFSLERHLVNALRARWGFMGSPVRLLFVQAKSERALPRKIEAKKTRTFIAKPKGKPLAKKSERMTGPRDSEKRSPVERKASSRTAASRKPTGRSSGKPSTGGKASHGKPGHSKSSQGNRSQSKQSAGARNSDRRNSRSNFTK